MFVVAKLDLYYFFPCPWTAEINDDIIAVGDHLESEVITEAYHIGVFPWPHQGYPVLWFCPEERGVLDFSNLHLSRSFKKWIRQNQEALEVTVNHDFHIVIEACRLAKRKDQKGSWITKPLQKAYEKLEQEGRIISLECWRDGKLISGIYGVKSQTYFSCESMFHSEDNASKFAFIKLVEHLQTLGFDWMDLQMVTPVSESFGAKYISRNDFLKRIKCPKY